MSRAQWRNAVLGLVVGGGFLYLAFRNVPLADLAAAFAHLRQGWEWLAAAILVSFAIMVVRAWRWQFELSPLAHVPLGRLWVVTSVAYMAINVLPVRLGEVVRPWLLSRREPVSFSNVVGNLVLEKTVDSVVLVLFILAGLSVVPGLPPWVRQGAVFPVIGAGVLLAVVVLLLWRGEHVVERVLARRLPPAAADRLRGITRAVIDGMKALPAPGLILKVFAVSVLLWFLPVLSSYLVIRAFEMPVPPEAALVVFIFIGFGTALPNAPGMVGTYQAACQLALALFGVDKAEGLAYGLVLNGIQLGTLVLQGLIAMPLAGVTLSEIGRAATKVEEAGVPGPEAT